MWTKRGKIEGEALGLRLRLALGDVLGLVLRTTLKLEEDNTV